MVSKYAKGESAGAAAAGKVRQGIHNDIPYDPADGSVEANPVTMYTGAGHVCADFANLMAMESRMLGLAASTRIVWGGVSSNNTANGTDTWVSSPLDGNTIIVDGSIRFSYHAVAVVDGIVQDAALDHASLTAVAIYAGLSYGGEIIRLMERDAGELITNGDFTNFVEINGP